MTRIRLTPPFAVALDRLSLIWPMHFSFRVDAVSATAQIESAAPPEDLARAIRMRLGKVKGLTVFPKVSRPLAPYEAISQHVYETALAAGLAQVNGDSNSGECATGACPIR